MNHKRILTLLMISVLLLISLSAAVVPAFAQGEDSTPAQPEGVRTLILLLGIMAILIVGASYLSLNPSRTPGNNADDEDDEDQ